MCSLIMILPACQILQFRIQTEKKQGFFIILQKILPLETPSSNIYHIYFVNITIECTV